MAKTKKVNESDWGRWGAKVGEKMECKFRSNEYKCNCRGYFFPLLLLLIGLFWLSKEMGWLDTEIPFWPVVLILIAVYWIINRIIKRIC